MGQKMRAGDRKTKKGEKKRGRMGHKTRAKGVRRLRSVEPRLILLGGDGGKGPTAGSFYSVNSTSRLGVVGKRRCLKRSRQAPKKAGEIPHTSRQHRNYAEPEVCKKGRRRKVGA